MMGNNYFNLADRVHFLIRGFQARGNKPEACCLAVLRDAKLLNIFHLHRGAPKNLIKKY
jgi:hypothetical protein